MRWKAILGKQALAFASMRSLDQVERIQPFPSCLSLRYSHSNVLTSYVSRGRSGVRFRSTTTTTTTQETTDSKDEASEEEEDLLRWERMYEVGEQESASQRRRNEGDSTAFDLQQEKKSHVRVISFDLDNTVWKTSVTIDTANNALASFLSEQNIVFTKRVEKIMGELFSMNKARYCPIDGEKAKAPVLLTLLRKDAIQHVLQTENGYSSDDAMDLAGRAFDVWVEARHVAIASNLANDVVATLNAISAIQTVHGTTVKICAITDGNSNPTKIQCLAEFFDFVVNAEQVGIAKPDKRIYLEAAKKILSDSQFSDLLLPNMNTIDADTTATTNNEEDHPNSWSDDAIENLIGPWWVHIGDDFVKDIVAAKSLNMRSIWVKELVPGAVAAGVESQIRRPQRTVEELVQEVADKPVVEMQVGAEDYLAQSLQAEFADAVVDRFADLRTVLFGWNQEAFPSASSSILDADDTSSTPALPEPSGAAFTTTLLEENDPGGTAKTHKFCIDCGDRILLQARFCSSCGKRQGD